MNIRKYISYKSIIIVLTIVFFVVYSWFLVTATLPGQESTGQLIFSWPDAMANNYFIEHFVDNGNFKKVESLNQELSSIIHPRSANVLPNSGDVVPVSFLGFVIILGLIGKIIGLTLVRFITPLAAVIAVFYFYKLISRIFNEQTGFLSAILLFSLASFWYYASLVMLPTVLFTSLLIVGLYYFVLQGEEKYKWHYSALSGLLVGLALIVRLSELVWVLALLLVITIAYKNKFNWTRLLYFILGGIVPVALLLGFNWQTYGSMFSFGYFNTTSNLDLLSKLPTEIEIGQSGSVIGFLKLLFIPFGFYETRILGNIMNYFVLMFWPYVGVFICGLIFWLRQWLKNRKVTAQLVYLIGSLVVFVILIIYYGSWQFVDKMVLENNTIGSSYMRYWLPLNIIILPFIAYLLVQINKLPLKKIWSNLIVGVVVFCLIGYSFALVYQTPGDGLIDQKIVLQSYHDRARTVQGLIFEDSIVITDRTDKLLFPKYRVIDFNLDYTIFTDLKKVINAQSVYYLNLLGEEDIDYINDRKLQGLGLKLVEPSQIDSVYKLYKLQNLE
ncbi:hypothetical protein HN858_01250 [Candidatus Falkowbacteria bacterium]|jgi:hypothetical protein|nr:hypothetical protein [Candidatus Falkowbacteria bacterium]MBT5502756.1 hypothetical protein [Candidatus Falkowbacteria bacterium]MBT6573461.1 hypothetical protein [Candidatus Falkowbacteria bacterium]MBT7348282.1 hypothetical protein [Candidatus Falkowbacteria bacterium]MBT7501154.1 hypothetical protein [Candidatus Falkowbacteria bacterium]